MTVKMKKAALLEELEAKRPILATIDSARLAQHKMDVKAVAGRRRAALRELTKLPDKTLGEMESWKFRDKITIGNAASCPMSLIADLDKAIDHVRLDSRGTFTMKDGDPWLSLLRRQINPAEQTVC